MYVIFFEGINWREKNHPHIFIETNKCNDFNHWKNNYELLQAVKSISFDNNSTWVIYHFLIIEFIKIFD